MTAAYWVDLTEDWSTRHETTDRPHRLGDSFLEEVVACLLGGHGITYEMNVAAFHALRDAGVLGETCSASSGAINDILNEPLSVAGRRIRYRFPNQKAERIAQALHRLAREPIPTDPLIARDWLLTFAGIGPKTASWVVRNQFATDAVAIIDIHVQRAGVQAGIFDPDWAPARDYWTMEAAFLQWAAIGEVSAADLDAVIWLEQAAKARRSRFSA